MKKKVRLTESDLHRIVSESVRMVLKEAQLTELDPRTYASYAQKRRQQGQIDKAYDGEKTAVDAWNRRFGYDKPLGDLGIRQYQGMSDPEDYDGMKYNIERGRVYDFGDGKNYDSCWVSNQYDPNTDTSSGEVTNFKGNNVVSQKHLDNTFGWYDKKHDRGVKTAREMARGNGKYIKGKGWQDN